MFLIVDDSRPARVMVANLISERKPDAVIKEAVDAEEAPAAARLEAPGHVILDHNMSGTTGLDLVRALRDAAPDASITLVTASIQNAIRQRAQEIGCNFVAKPLTAQKVDALLSDLEGGA